MQRTHVLQAAAVAVLWGLNFVAIDYGVDAFPPLLFAALRFTFVALPLVFFVPRPKVPFRIIAGVGVFVCVGQFGLLFTAIHLGMPAGLSSLVLQSQAMFTVAFAAVFLGERPGRARVLALAVAAAGLGVIAIGRGQSAGLGAFALVVAAGASWGLGNVITRQAGGEAGFGLVVWSAVVPPVPLFGLSLAFEGWSADRDALAGIDLAGGLALAYIVVVSTFVGYGLWNHLLGRFPAHAVAPFSLLVPVFSIAATAAVLGERPTGWDLAGGAVVLAGIALASRPRRRVRKPVHEAAPTPDGRAPQGARPSEITG